MIWKEGELYYLALNIRVEKNGRPGTQEYRFQAESLEKLLLLAAGAMKGVM